MKIAHFLDAACFLAAGFRAGIIAALWAVMGG
jgi:hypothetical protein